MSASPILTMLPPLRAGTGSAWAAGWPGLEDGEVLCAALAIDWTRVDQLMAFAMRHVLAAECAAAGRYLHRQDRLRHLLGRALLRQLAARYGGSDPARPMPLNRWGKPEPDGCTVACNLTHAGGFVLAAAGRVGALGIDVEVARAPRDAHDIAAVFHPAERAALAQAGHADRAFMRCWSRKEAIAKAVGMGLSLPLDAFAVASGAMPHGWLQVAPPGTALADWRTLDLPVDPAYVSALAIHRCGRQVKFAFVDIG